MQALRAIQNELKLFGRSKFAWLDCTSVWQFSPGTIYNSENCGHVDNHKTNYFINCSNLQTMKQLLSNVELYQSHIRLEYNNHASC